MEGAPREERPGTAWPMALKGSLQELVGTSILFIETGQSPRVLCMFPKPNRRSTRRRWGHGCAM